MILFNWLSVLRVGFNCLMVWSCWLECCFFWILLIVVRRLGSVVVWNVDWCFGCSFFLNCLSVCLNGVFGWILFVLSFVMVIVIVVVLVNDVVILIVEGVVVWFWFWW